jgi:hypothetical protein
MMPAGFLFQEWPQELVIKDLYIAHLVIASKKAGSLTWLFSLLDCRKVEFAPCILGFSSFVG